MNTPRLWVGWDFYLIKKSKSKSLNLFLMYFAGYSLLFGFGYLFFDPIFANPNSIGNWAGIVNLLGGSWAVRIPIIIVGAIEVLFTFFLIARNMKSQAQTKKDGAILCILPYITNSIIISMLSFFFHPLEIPGTIAVLMQYWLGTSGFLWAFFIAFTGKNN